MDERDLRRTLESSNDKLSVFADSSLLTKYKGLTVSSLFSLIDDFLNDSQKAALFEFEHFKNINQQLRILVATSISDNNIKLELLQKPNGILSDLQSYQISDFLESLDSSYRLKLLQDPASLKNLKLNKYSMQAVVCSLSDNDVINLLEDIDYVKEQLNLDDFLISGIISNISSEKDKLDLLSNIFLDSYCKASALATVSDSAKATILSDNEYNFNYYELCKILSSMDTKFLINYFNEHTDFFDNNNITLRSVVEDLSYKNQLSFVAQIDKVNLDERPKKADFSYFTSGS